MRARIAGVILSLLAGIGVSSRSLAEEETSPTAAAYRPLSVEERDEFLRSMARSLESVRSMRADFVQERRLSLFLDTLTAKGICCFERPNKLRWELSEPYVTVLIYNGKKVAKFDRVDGRFRRMNLGAEDLLREVLGQVIGWIKGDFKDAKELYEIRLLKGSDYRLVLRPRSKDLRKMIEAVELSIDPASLRVRCVTVREPQDDCLEIRFLKEQLNPPFDPGTFDPKDPLLPKAPASGDETSQDD